jgi:hypothetical protein
MRICGRAVAWCSLIAFSCTLMVCCSGNSSGESPDPPVPDVPSDRKACEREGVPTMVDLVFVIDNSPSMSGRLIRLVDSVTWLIASEKFQGLGIDLQIGVVGIFERELHIFPNYSGTPPDVATTVPCDTDTDCCEEFCHDYECASDPACIEECCASPDTNCTVRCIQEGSKTPGENENGVCNVVASQEPDSCTTTEEFGEWFRCTVFGLYRPELASFSQQRQEHLEAAWEGIGATEDQSSRVGSFHRSNSHLVLLFVTNTDDCTVHSDYCSPQSECAEDADCDGGGKCRIDTDLSALVDEPHYRCCGTFDDLYAETCPSLGEYHGPQHHQCAYDLSCSECASDSDCLEDGWGCREGMKCRPYFDFDSVASFQSPSGWPIYSLMPTSELAEQFASLRSGPAQVVIAVAAGFPKSPSAEDEVPIKPECLANVKLVHCAEYEAVTGQAGDACAKAPSSDDCQALEVLFKKCVEECVLSFQSGGTMPDGLTHSYACSGPGEGQFAGLGNRLKRFAESFGQDSFIFNECEAAAGGQALWKALNYTVGLACSEHSVE